MSDMDKDFWNDAYRQEPNQVMILDGSVTGDEPAEVVLVDEVWSWNDAAPRLVWGDGM